MAEEKTPEEIRDNAMALIEKGWKTGQINFGEFRRLVARADHTYSVNRDMARTKKLTNLEKVRSEKTTTEEGCMNTVAEIQSATYIKIPAGLLVLLYTATQKDSKIIQDKYGKPILDLLQKGELS